ncbi:MAG: sugar transferase [Candidatus Omnitrophota bacterium]
MLTKLRKKRKNIYFSGLLMFSDFLAVIIAFIFSYLFRFYSRLFSVPFGVPRWQDYIVPVLFIAGLLIYFINSRGLYKPDPAKKFIDQAFPLIKCTCITMLIVFAGTFFYREVSYSRLLLFIIWFSIGVLLVFFRYLLNIFYLQNILPRIRKKIIIVCKPESVEHIQKYNTYFTHYGTIAGFVSIRKQVQEKTEIPCLGHIDEFEHILDSLKPDEVILADLELPRKRITTLIVESEKRLIKFKIVADLLDIMIQQFELENIDGLNLIKIKESPLTLASNRFIKRLIDICGSFFGIVLLSPFLLAVAVLVKLGSRGPVFFSQERVGEDGRIFKIYKFRTMQQDAEAHTGPVFVKKDDERCTSLGKTLRKYNIDELPQLFNVLRGEMSLVGPRPERPYFVEQFKDDIPRYMSRHHIKSGITGWAQVHGLRQGTAIDERVKYDLYYVENWSAWLDIKIIFLSFFALKNAY